MKYLFKEINEASHSYLSKDEVLQLQKYINLYYDNNCREHYQVNEIIEDSHSWAEFDAIRSINKHGSNTTVRGIAPKYFAIACQVIGMNKGNGHHLTSSQKW